MKKYICCALCSAEKMTRGEYNAKRGWKIPENENPADAGYYISYDDGHETWLPKETFEKNHMELVRNEDLPSEYSVSEKMVSEFVSYIETKTIGDRSTVVRGVLRNGFEIIESSSCVDPANYSEEIGAEICRSKIRDKIWGLLGFLLATAKNGMNN